MIFLLLFSCVSDKIDEDTSTRIDGPENLIRFSSAGSKFDNWVSKNGTDVQLLRCTPAKWGQISGEVTPIKNRRATKGRPNTLVTDIATAGVVAYSTVGSNFNTDPSTGSTPNFMYNQLISQTAGVWSYTPAKYWISGATSKTSFFAYTPYATGSNGITLSSSNIKGTPYLTYTVPSIAANQPDLMIAPPQLNLSSGAVNFALKHALASVGFSLQGNKKDKVKNIGIKGMSVSGQLSLDGTSIVWSNLGTTTTTPINAGINYDAGQTYVTTTATRIPSSTLMKSDGYLMVIPQTLTTSTILVITFDDNSTKEIALNTSTPNWVAGNSYTYSITISPLMGTSNSYIITPSALSSKTILINAIPRVNHFWGNAAGGGFNSANGDGYVALGNLTTNMIGTSDQWYFSVIWADFAG